MTWLENPVWAKRAMKHPIKRVEFVRKYIEGIFAEDVHAKRVMSLASGAVGVMTGAFLAVSIIGQSLAQARGLLSKHAIKQVDRLLSNQGIVVWDMFAPWVAEVAAVLATVKDAARRAKRGGLRPSLTAAARDV